MRFLYNYIMSFYYKLRKPIKLYQSIEELPIWNFDKMMKGETLKYICKDPNKYKEDEQTLIKAGEQWIKLYDEYLAHFGLSTSYEKILSQEDKITRLIIQRWLKEDKSLETIIKIEQGKLNELNGKKKNSSTFEEDVAVIEKYRGIGIDVKKTSVKMFYTYVKLMEKDGQKN